MANRTTDSRIEYPWSAASNQTARSWISQGYGAHVIEGAFKTKQILDLVDHAEKEDDLRGMSREEAVLLLGLWIGRYVGVRDPQYNPDTSSDDDLRKGFE